MSVYNYSGDIISNVYSYDSDLLNHVYDVYGNLISASDMTVVKVMSYNVGGFYIGSGTNVPNNHKTDYENLLRNTITKNKCDIMVMEEYWNTFCANGTTAESILDDYYSSNDAIGGNSQYGGRCISMNYPLLESSNFAFSQMGVQGNTLVNLVNIGGHDVYILGVHLDWQQQARQELQVQELLAYLADKEYFILCGDFNPGVRTTEDRTSEDYIGVCKPFIDAGYNMVNWKETFIPTSYNGTSAEDSTTILCLDNIITSSNITIYRSYTDTTKLTDDLHDTIDHIPIVATLLLQPKTFSVLGDSYSTFTDDVYPLTNNVWYDGTKNGVTNKSMTWYRLFEESSGFRLDRNASFSGSPICYDGWGDGTEDARYTCFYARANDVADSDYILVFGGTNDSWIGVSLGEYKYSNWTEEDMKTFRPALARLFDTLISNYPSSQVIFIQNTGLTSGIQNSISTICTHYSVPIITLSNITKVDEHPTNVGMQEISNQVAEYFSSLET